MVYTFVWEVFSRSVNFENKFGIGTNRVPGKVSRLSNWFVSGPSESRIFKLRVSFVGTRAIDQRGRKNTG